MRAVTTVGVKRSGGRAPAPSPCFASRARAAVTGALATTAAACSERAPSVLDPQGPAAREVTGLWWPMLWTSVAVSVFVAAMATWGIVRSRRRRAEDVVRQVSWGDRFILVAGLGVTGIVLLAFFVISLRSMSALAAGGRPGALEVTVIGHDWWWEARYPNGAVTANEIHIPSGEPVRLRLRSADVIHSFWVPQLGPKVDMIPGRENDLWLQADRPGRYRGACAEFCGLQHAHMLFFVVADPPDAFRRWMRAAAAAARPPADAITERGREVFLTGTCAGCHAIRGTPADAQLGPDLTHLAARETIAAGTLALTPQNLRRWILEPQEVKPGATMPPVQLSEESLRALIAYLMSLTLDAGS